MVDSVVRVTEAGIAPYEAEEAEKVEGLHADTQKHSCVWAGHWKSGCLVDLQAVGCKSSSTSAYLSLDLRMERLKE